MKYIALTIGPIVDTLSLGRKTSEVWMASYLFSSFMKNVIKEIKKNSDAMFIVPFVDDEILTEKDNGVGMFHDRFILQSDTLTLNKIENILQVQKDKIAVMVAQSIGKDEEKVKAFFTQYIQAYLFETTRNFENPILDISKIMDSIELHVPLLEAEEDYMRIFLNRDTILKSSLAKASFGGKPSFRALDDIALGNEDALVNANRYVAIIYADGDNLGKFIKKQDNVTEVSKRLFEFDKKAVKTIEAYDAMPIFIGGDDLIIFAPLLNKEKTVFNLLDELSANYKDALQTEESTLSFGVSFTYYKYPLYEALEKSRDTLFGVAKQYKGKNAVAVSIQKHSGQSFDFCVGKKEETYNKFLELTKSILSKESKLPHAVHHKLTQYNKVFESIPQNRISSTFENIFNEDLHKDEFKDGLKKLQDLMKSMKNDIKNINVKSIETISKELITNKINQNKLFSMLSTIKILRGDR